MYSLVCKGILFSVIPSQTNLRLRFYNNLLPQFFIWTWRQWLPSPSIVVYLILFPLLGQFFLQQRCWCPRKDGQVRVHDREGNGGTCWIRLVAFTKTLVIIFNAYAGLAWPGEQSKSSRYWTIPHALHFSSRFCFRDRVSLEVFQGKVAFSGPSLRALQDWLNSQLTKFLSKILRVGSNGVILRKTVDQHR